MKKRGDFRRGQRNLLSSQEIGTGYNFFSKYKNYTGQRRGIQTSLLFVRFDSGLLWRNSQNKGKEKEGIGIFHSSVC